MPISFRHSVRESWDRRDPDLMGRFDFLWDGEGVPKMAGRLEVLARISNVRPFVTHTATNCRPLGLNTVAEYNADTPTVLIESAAAQVE